MSTAVKFVGSIMTTISLILSVINSYLLYNLLNVPTTMWIIFWATLIFLVFGLIVTALGGDN